MDVTDQPPCILFTIGDQNLSLAADDLVASSRINLQQLAHRYELAHTKQPYVQLMLGNARFGFELIHYECTQKKSSARWVPPLESPSTSTCLSNASSRVDQLSNIGVE